MGIISLVWLGVGSADSRLIIEGVLKVLELNDSKLCVKCELVRFLRVVFHMNHDTASSCLNPWDFQLVQRTVQ